MIGYLEVPKPSYPPYFDQLIERYQPLWENVLNNNFYWWDFHTQEGKVRISVRVVCISLRGSEHQEQQTGQPITINKQQTTPRTNTGSPGKCKGQARPSTLILALFWSLHGCQVRANLNEQLWTKLAQHQTMNLQPSQYESLWGIHNGVTFICVLLHKMNHIYIHTWNCKDTPNQSFATKYLGQCPATDQSPAQLNSILMRRQIIWIGFAAKSWSVCNWPNGS